MSRFCGDTSPQAVLEAAETWKQRCLLADGSVLSDRRLWQPALFDELDQYFVQRPEEGEGNFFLKLRQQLEPAQADAKMLAAEMLWVMYLCPSSLTPHHKRQSVEQVWTWSGQAVPTSAAPWLSDPVLEGIGSGGPGFNQNQWRELAYMIGFAAAFKGLASNVRAALLADASGFDEWLSSLNDSKSRQLRHMLLFLLFPDSFERIFGATDRKAVVQHYSAMSTSEVNRLAPVALDRELQEIRKKLETLHGTKNLDFYTPPLRDEWRSDTFPAATASVTASHVIAAIEEIRRDGVPPNAASTFFDLLYQDRRYPPKYVLSLAVKNATGEILPRERFSGGKGSPAFRLLQKLGFDIVDKVEGSEQQNEIAESAVASLIEDFLTQAKEATNLSTQGYLGEYRDLEVRVSFGKGNVARIPWVAFLADGQTVSKGIYPVLLFFRALNKLLLCFGVSEENKAPQAWGTLPARLSVREWFNANGMGSPDRYGDSWVAAGWDTTGALPTKEIQQQLDAVIDHYHSVLDVEPSPVIEVLPIRADLKATIEAFGDALEKAGVNYGSGHSLLLSSFLCSLAAKPFAILTGLSGSGKTQLAIRFGEYLGENRVHVAAVRPDWTGAEALFGYEDALRPRSEDGRSAWVVPAPLQFMLEAANDPAHPYLLVLDEMNLAHVERYFADVLSGMESGAECLPNLEPEKGEWRLRKGSPLRIKFPRNLFIVGTVNVDETTYMFSPKVLDRANTFEFRVATADLADEPVRPAMVSAGEMALVRGFLQIALGETPTSVPLGAVRAKLRLLHSVLSRYGLEFGHRVYLEALRFSGFALSTSLLAEDQVLDRIVLQKVLPRFHGSRRRIETPLLAMARFCYGLPEQIEADQELPSLVDGLWASSSSARLPQSMEKIRRMLESLRANQFASFTE